MRRLSCEARLSSCCALRAAAWALGLGPPLAAPLNLARCWQINTMHADAERWGRLLYSMH